jgi:hypothetical protein
MVPVEFGTSWEQESPSGQNPGNESEERGTAKQAGNSLDREDAGR